MNKLNPASLIRQLGEIFKVQYHKKLLLCQKYSKTVTYNIKKGNTLV